MWRWDGTQWVATAAGPAAMPATRRSRAWIWWVAGGCALVLVLAVVGGAIGIASLVNSFQHGGLTCLPADFPNYPGSSVVNEKTYYGTGVAPGDSKSCQMTLDSNDNVATVTEFYNEKLSSGDWKVVGFNSSSGQIHFQRVSRPLTVGTVDLLGRGSGAEIRIDLSS
jgi:hypothetical protein